MRGSKNAVPFVPKNENPLFISIYKIFLGTNDVCPTSIWAQKTAFGHTFFDEIDEMEVECC